MDSLNNNTLYENIKSLRTSKELSQEELAKRVGYSDRTMIAKIEAGKVDLPQSKIAIFAAALNVSPSELVGASFKLDIKFTESTYLVERMINALGYSIIFEEEGPYITLVDKEKRQYEIENDDLVELNSKIREYLARELERIKAKSRSFSHTQSNTSGNINDASPVGEHSETYAAHSDSDLTISEAKQLLEFAKFIKQQRKK